MHSVDWANRFEGSYGAVWIVTSNVERHSVFSFMDHISTFEELDDLMTKLHDCPFDLKQSSFDKMSGVWSGIFLRPLWDHPRVERHGVSPLYLKTQLPVVEATI